MSGKCNCTSIHDVSIDDIITWQVDTANTLTSLFSDICSSEHYEPLFKPKENTEAFPSTSLLGMQSHTTPCLVWMHFSQH
jgi:hypothetical protein